MTETNAAPAPRRNPDARRKGFVERMSLEIRHPSVAPSRWRIMPSLRTERHLAATRIQCAWKENRLLFWGETGREADDGRTRELFDFWLFCSDPYFVRGCQVPVCGMGDETLAIVVGMDGASIAKVPFTDSMRDRLERQRRRFSGNMFGPPPAALAFVPSPAGKVNCGLLLKFAPRSLYWRYRVQPRGSADLAVLGPCRFARVEDGDAFVFTSEIPLPLTLAPAVRLSLVMKEEGLDLPLVKNLPMPNVANLTWDRELNEYRGEMRISLEHYRGI